MIVIYYKIHMVEVVTDLFICSSFPSSLPSPFLIHSFPPPSLPLSLPLSSLFFSLPPSFPPLLPSGLKIATGRSPVKMTG